MLFFSPLIKEYEKMETPEERLTKAREIYDHHIMVEMLAHAHNYSKDSLQHVQYHLLKGSVPPDLFQVCEFTPLLSYPSHTFTAVHLSTTPVLLWALMSSSARNHPCSLYRGNMHSGFLHSQILSNALRKITFFFERQKTSLFFDQDMVPDLGHLKYLL
ncbi:unnamed protein product [Strongylus vulgaris]|uniref:RGS domain-containing protein n=1 Tax=Strongylus vulgaris TaxID=40348 RepID=A0A3P7KG50_STRVU|nr:unnamed protein product [Strongylus vulgaris]